MYLSFLDEINPDGDTDVNLWKIFLILGIVAFIVYLIRHLR